MDYRRPQRFEKQVFYNIFQVIFYINLCLLRLHYLYKKIVDINSFTSNINECSYEPLHETFHFISEKNTLRIFHYRKYQCQRINRSMEWGQ